MATMNGRQRDDFLGTPRLGILTQLREDGAPVAVPVWFEWTGGAVRIFTGADSPKAKRARRDPRASLLATNAVGEPEAWVAFDGDLAVGEAGHGAFELAERLAVRYWDMRRDEHKRTVEEWRAAAEHLCVLEMRPNAIRTNSG
jgi:PPOX class probable F420-dependent enzyme